MLDTRYRKVEIFEEMARSYTGPVSVMWIKVKNRTEENGQTYAVVILLENFNVVYDDKP